MIRRGDLLEVRGHRGTAAAAQDASGAVLLTTGNRVPADECEILCTFHARIATRFRHDGAALCAICCESYPVSMLRDVRPELGELVTCACGEPLEAGTSNGTWTLEGIACEYRTCVHCRGTRAFMPADVVPGREVGCYADPDSSELTGAWSSLLDALEVPPPNERAELVRNGVTLARTFRSARGDLGWHVQKPEHETPVSM